MWVQVPLTPPKLIGCVAQLVRALRSHRRGRRFESAHIHHKNQIGKTPILFFIVLLQILPQSLTIRAKVAVIYIFVPVQINTGLIFVGYSDSWTEI